MLYGQIWCWGGESYKGETSVYRSKSAYINKFPLIKSISQKISEKVRTMEKWLVDKKVVNRRQTCEREFVSPSHVEHEIFLCDFISSAAIFTKRISEPGNKKNQKNCFSRMHKRWPDVIFSPTELSSKVLGNNEQTQSESWYIRF